MTNVVSDRRLVIIMKGLVENRHYALLFKKKSVVNSLGYGRLPYLQLLGRFLRLVRLDLGQDLRY